jgi:hypothetical protein
MKRIVTMLLVLFVVIAVCAIFFAATPPPKIMGVSIGMNRTDARAHLQSAGTLERETRKRQEVWAIKDERISHLLVGYDPEFRVRYVTAIARTGGPRVRYEDVADLKSAQREENQGNYKFTWQLAARLGHAEYVMIAHGHDAQYLESYSVKKVDQEGEADEDDE